MKLDGKYYVKGGDYLIDFIKKAIGRFKKSDDFDFSAGESDSNKKEFFKLLENEIESFKGSQKRNAMFLGERYFDGKHDILNRKRMVIGQGGELTEVFNLPNNTIIDNQYARMVEQKNNYLLSKEITFQCDNKVLLDCVKNIFGAKFMKILKSIGQDCFNCGIGYMYVFYNDFGKIDFKKLEPFEIIPFWKDEEHHILDFALRIYEKEVIENGSTKIIEKAELFTDKGIFRFFLKGGSLIPDGDDNFTPYIYFGGENYDFGKIPIVPFRQNDREIPLILKVKELQDALNAVQSDFLNNIQEDARNTILVLKNYDGTNLGEFRKNLSKFGVVKVKSVDGADGGVSTLKIDVNCENFKTVISNLKTAIVENARGIDSKSDKMYGDLSRMNIQSIYSDIDLDANSMEMEFKASFNELFFFIKFYLKNLYLGNFDSEVIKVIFNRDILINESEAIDNCIKSLQILSRESVISQHPWVNDVISEIKKIGGTYDDERGTFKSGSVRGTDSNCITVEPRTYKQNEN